jgi:hypothetical protein
LFTGFFFKIKLSRRFLVASSFTVVLGAIDLVITDPRF